jgi:hypothetical protein
VLAQSVPRDFKAIKAMVMGIKKQQQLVKRSKNIIFREKSPISAGVWSFGDDGALMEHRKYNEPLECMREEEDGKCKPFFNIQRLLFSLLLAVRLFVR